MASSTNRGASFSAAKRVTTTAVQGEIGIGADGTLYVNWNDAGNLNLAKSSNGGATWSAPIRMRQGLQTTFLALCNRCTWQSTASTFTQFHKRAKNYM
jgi:hypothetical protein